jgi:hypothetical protein
MSFLLDTGIDGRCGVEVVILAYYARGCGFDSRTMQTFVCMNMSVCIGSGCFYVSTKNGYKYITCLVQSTAHHTIHFGLCTALMARTLALVLLHCKCIMWRPYIPTLPMLKGAYKWYVAISQSEYINLHWILPKKNWIYIAKKKKKFVWRN